MNESTSKYLHAYLTGFPCWLSPGPEVARGAVGAVLVVLGALMLEKVISPPFSDGTPTAVAPHCLHSRQLSSRTSAEGNRGSPASGGQRAKPGHHYGGALYVVCSKRPHDSTFVSYIVGQM